MFHSYKWGFEQKLLQIILGILHRQGSCYIKSMMNKSSYLFLCNIRTGILSDLLH